MIDFRSLLFEYPLALCALLIAMGAGLQLRRGLLTLTGSDYKLAVETLRRAFVTLAFAAVILYWEFRVRPVLASREALAIAMDTLKTIPLHAAP